jgi:hypothetical protein
LSALGKKDDGILVWEQGYKIAVRHSTDLKQLLELEELLASAKPKGTIGHEDHVMDSSSAASFASESGSEICSASTPEIHNKKKDASEVHIRPNNGAIVNQRPNNGAIVNQRPNNGAIVNQKVFVTGISKSKSISLDFRLSRGIAQV